MRLRRIAFRMILCCITFILFSGCDPESRWYTSAKKSLYLYPNKTNLTVNETIQFRIEYSSKNMDPDRIYAIPLIENVEIKVLEGTVIPTDMEDMIFIDFVRPDLEDEETESFLPYCNLELKFLKAGTYDFRIVRSTKPEFYLTFEGGGRVKFTVTE